MRLPSDLTNLLDRAVIAWILDGSAEARDELRRRYQARVYNAILKLVREPHTATDLTDLSFKKVFKKLGTFKQELPFAPWIFTIANNNVMDHFEKERRETQARDEWLWETTPGKRLREGVPAIDQTPSDPELNVAAFRQAYDEAQAQVNRTYLACFFLHYVEKKSYDEIARKLHIKTPAIARSYAHRAKTDLREMLGEMGQYLKLEISPA